MNERRGELGRGKGKESLQWPIVFLSILRSDIERKIPIGSHRSHDIRSKKKDQYGDFVKSNK